MKDLFVSFIGTGLIQLANIVSGVMAARLLLPEGRGELAAAILWVSIIATVGCLSIDQAVTYFTASRRQDAARLFVAGMALAAVLAGASVAVGFVALPLALASYSPEVNAAARLYLWFIPLQLAGMVIMAYLRGTLQFVEWNVLRVMLPAVYVGGLVVVFVAGVVSVRSFLVAFLSAQCATIALGMVLIFWRRLENAAARAGDVRSLVRYSAAVHLGSLTLFVGRRLDQALVSLFLRPADLGLYVVALTLAGGAGLIAGTIELLAFPRIAGEETVGGKALVFGRYTRLSVFLSAGTVAVLFALAPWLIELFFGAAYLPSAELARILLLGAIPYSGKSVIAMGFKAHGRMRVVNQAEFLGAVVAVVCLTLLLPRFGVLGAAWAIVIVQFATGAFLAAKLPRELGIGLKFLLMPTRADWDFARVRLNAFVNR